MADELDDLFGAIDGEQEEEEVEEKKVESSKKKEDDDHDDDAEAENDVGMAEDTKESSSQDHKKEDGDKSSATKKLYTSVMSAKTATRLHKHADAATAESTAHSIEAAKKNKDNREQTADENKDISTGTSHDKSVRSYSAYPKSLPEGMKLPTPQPPSKPAKEYTFPLDPFQAQAVGYIDKEESVLVAAHTSAGKTAVAEYAIAKSLNNGQRVVYTSPIKVRNSQNEMNVFPLPFQSITEIPLVDLVPC